VEDSRENNNEPTLIAPGKRTWHADMSDTVININIESIENVGGVVPSKEHKLGELKKESII
jgi:hypothetical protein